MDICSLPRKVFMVEVLGVIAQPPGEKADTMLGLVGRISAGQERRACASLARAAPACVQDMWMCLRGVSVPSAWPLTASSATSWNRAVAS